MRGLLCGWWLACSWTAPAPSTGHDLLVVQQTPEGARAARLSADGALTPLPTGPGQAFVGAPDPQGTHALVTITTGEGDAHSERLVLVPLDGGPPVPLAGPATRIRNPAWSPDGAWVVYESDEASFRDLYRVSRDGQHPRRLTDAPHGSFEPAVSPDGRRIAFASSRDNDAEIYVMTAQGGVQTRLTRSPGDDMRPRWSSDGRLAFLTRRHGTLRAWQMGSDGSRAQPLLPADPGEHLDLAWQPDGTRIAITRQQALELDVVVVHDTTIEATFGGPGAQEHPAWSPDGHRLAWSSTVGGRATIQAGRPDGTEVRRVLRSDEEVWLPQWLPTPAD